MTANTKLDRELVLRGAARDMANTTGAIHAITGRGRIIRIDDVAVGADIVWYVFPKRSKKK